MSGSSSAVYKLFDLNPQELIFQDFQCSMQKGIIYFGRLFLAEYHFLFYASFFAVKQKLKIEIEQVETIELQGKNIVVRWKTDKPGLLEATFGAIAEVEVVYRFMHALWKGETLDMDISTGPSSPGGIEINFN